MWKYFDPDSDAAVSEPVDPMMPVDEPPHVRNAHITRNYGKWGRYHEVNVNLRKRIQSTIALQKKATLRTIYTVCKWITVLRDSTTLHVETLRLNIQLEYRKLRLTLKPISKPKASQAVFATRGVNFNGEEVQMLRTQKLEPRLLKGQGPHPRKSRNGKIKIGREAVRGSPRPYRRTNGRKRDPCTGCGGLLYNFSKCYLSTCLIYEKD